MQICVSKCLGTPFQFWIFWLFWVSSELFHVVCLYLFIKQVLQVVKKTKSLKRISFLAHSLGGLFARYAIAVLYSRDTYNRDQHGDLAHSTAECSQSTSFSKGGILAGLEPINFITLATPHLGVRGKRQVCSGPSKLLCLCFLLYINF